MMNKVGVALLAAILAGGVLRADGPALLSFDARAEAVFKQLSPNHRWFHPRVAPVPGHGMDGQPAVIMTIQKHLAADDHYSGMYFLRTNDLGKTWTGPTEIAELAWKKGENDETIAVCDVTPGWHARSGKLLAIGIKLRYSRRGEQLLDKPRSHECAYATYDPKTDRWTPWKVLAMPETDGKFFLVAPGCVQWLEQTDGSLLVPTYFKGRTGSDYSVTVLHCSFDGRELKYLKHGDELTRTGGRGYCEPSLALYQSKYYLTLRNHARGYVTTSTDGLHFTPVQPWTFDDGTDLGSYNTQAHWLVHGGGLFLAYTRRGAGNDHIPRNRAPLFLAQVDPTNVRVIRKTEKELLPERGVMLGNFGATAVTPQESWVTDAEFILGTKPHARGADGTVWLGRVTWSAPNRHMMPTAEVRKPPEYTWQQVTAKAAFAPRDGAGGLTFKGRMWLLGGWNPGDRKHFPRICNNEVWSSADGKNWRLDRANKFLDRNFDAERDWEGRHTAGYVVFKDRMWIVGGDVNQGHYHSDVWNSTDGKEWAHVNRGKPVPWGPRALHYTVVHDGKIWVIGGQTVPPFAPGKETFYRDVWNTTDGVHWTEVKPKEPFWPQRGMIGGSAVFQGRVWVIGGGTYDTPTMSKRKFFNDVWSSADGVNWIRHVANAPWAPRQYHEVAVFDGRLWVLEGYSGSNRNDVWHSADGVHWHEVPNTPWKPRHAASVFVHDNALWMVAGNNMESDVWRLNRKKTDHRPGE